MARPTTARRICAGLCLAAGLCGWVLLCMAVGRFVGTHLARLAELIEEGRAA